jgi:hypothetical protein
LFELRIQWYLCKLPLGLPRIWAVFIKKRMLKKAKKVLPL